MISPMVFLSMYCRMRLRPSCGFRAKVNTAFSQNAQYQCMNTLHFFDGPQTTKCKLLNCHFPSFMNGLRVEGMQESVTIGKASSSQEHADGDGAH